MTKPERIRRQFVIELGAALHRYGTPTHRLEMALGRLSSMLDLQAQILATPTSMTMAFGPMDDQQVTLLRVEPGGINLEKLADLNALVDETINGNLRLDDALKKLRKMVKTSPRFNATWLVLAGAAASGAVARFFSGAWTEIILSFVIGLVVSILMVWGARRTETSRLIEPMAAVLAAFAVVGAACFWSINVNLVLVAALIVLVPGFSLTLAIKELATRHLVAGSARMFGATLVFLELGFGIILAHKLTQVLPVLPQRVGQPVSMWWSEVLALAISAVAFGIYFQAKPRHFCWVGLGSVLAYGGARMAGASLGAESGAFLGALLLGLGANTFARRTGQPASIVLIPGVILLVPGSVGLRSMTAIVLKDVMGGVQAGFAVMMIATAIVAGLLIADVASPARRSL